MKETVASEKDSPSPKIEGNQQTNDDSSITLETSENNSDVAQTHSDEFSTEYEQDAPPVEVESAKQNEILLATFAGFGFKRGTLNLYNDKLEFSCPQGTYMYPINEIKKVRKSLGCLEVTTIDNKMVSFGYNGDIVDQWVAKMIRMIPEENLNMQDDNNAGAAITNNTDNSLQLSNVKEAGTEKAKESLITIKTSKNNPY